MTTRDIADHLSGELLGDDSIIIKAPAKISEASVGNISFVNHPRFAKEAARTKASALVVDRSFDITQGIDTPLIVVNDIGLAVPKLLSLFDANKENRTSIARTSVIHPEAVIEETVSIGDFVVVHEGAVIKSGCIIHSHVYVGEEVSIGHNCIVHSGARIERACLLGDNVIIHPNAVIGSEGFGFSPDENGEYIKVPQLGNVILEDNVEVGSNTVIDRATMGSTVIRKGVKLDNLIQIAHNVEIKEHTVIAAQAGIAGSTTIGARSRIGGQVGIVGHIELADGIEIQAQSGIASSIEEKKSKWYGSPAIDYRTYLKSFAVFKKLPIILKDLEKIKKQLSELLKGKEEHDN